MSFYFVLSLCLPNCACAELNFRVFNFVQSCLYGKFSITRISRFTVHTRTCGYVHAIILYQVSTTHFNGLGASEGGSLTLSSNVLLSKMRSRNALLLPDAGQSHLHSDNNQDLLRKLRSFIAQQAKTPGKATTDEILSKFGNLLVPSESPVFRSMLHEICDFQRYHGDGLWTLKGDYR